MGGPQIRLGAATVEEQEVHTSWTALTNRVSIAGKAIELMEPGVRFTHGVEFWVAKGTHIYRCPFLPSRRVLALAFPLAANADKDDQDGDHESRRCCNGSK